MDVSSLSKEIDSLMAEIESTSGVKAAPSQASGLDDLDALVMGLQSQAPKPKPTPAPSPALRNSGAMMPPRTSVPPPAATGGVSTGPGLISTGPGAAFVKPQQQGRTGTNIGGIASHTPDGRAIGVNAVNCDYCNKPIVGQVVNAIGKQYHPEHFVCANCSQPFKDGKFLEHEGKPYCEDHFYELFAARCYRCEQPIKEKVIKALGHSWHPNHFTCTGCGCDLVGKQYREAGGDPYCPDCKKNLEIFVDPKIHICARCKKPIIGWYVTLQGQRMHPEHFRCEACGKEFQNGDCHEHNGKFYCGEDYNKLQKANCAGCRKPIIGRSITAMGRVWHPEHFCCTHCHAPFSGSKYHEKDGLPYCTLHYNQLFGRPCAKCGKAVTHDGVEALGKTWHREHFTCHTCETPLEVGDKLCSWENKPMCKKCYLNLPKDVRKKVQKKQTKEEKAKKKRQKQEMQANKQIQKENKAAAKNMLKGMVDVDDL